MQAEHSEQRHRDVLDRLSRTTGIALAIENKTETDVGVMYEIIAESNGFVCTYEIMGGDIRSFESALSGCLRHMERGMSHV